jgi:putative transposase
VKPTRLLSPPGTYFITFSTWHRRRLFVVESFSRLFLKTLYSYRRQGRFQLHAFVVMPDHVHLLLTPSVDITLERAIQFIKGGYSYLVRKELERSCEIWQRGFTDHRIRDENDFQFHRNYIDRNPVQRNLVANVSGYRFCSAYPDSNWIPGPQRLKPSQ